MSDVRQRILAGDYDPPGDYPDQPARPPVLRKAAGELTEAEVAGLARVRAEYAAARGRYEEAVRYRMRVQGDCQARFREDLLAEHGIAVDDPFGREMYALAWGRGHGSGYDEVVTAFEELLPLWELYRANKSA